MFAFEDDVFSALFAEDVIKHVVHDAEVFESAYSYYKET